VNLNLTPLQILGIALVVNGALIGSTTQLTDIMGPHIAHIVVSAASVANSILGGIVTMFSGLCGLSRRDLIDGGIDRNL